ncbi:MAG: cell division protein FtsL [Coxiellaceae bacterium]|nr:MAG: cell division protein FtsL [Coxiellaceae bacterium]
MNTAVRALPSRSTAGRANVHHFNWWSTLKAMILFVIVLFSAIAVVYVKDLNRRLYINYQGLQEQQNQIYIDWGKLLLEQSTWSTQARVQEIAEKRLNMQVTAPKTAVLIDNMGNVINNKK